MVLATIALGSYVMSFFDPATGRAIWVMVPTLALAGHFSIRMTTLLLARPAIADH